MNDRKPTVAVDFDGVIHAYSRGWQGGECYDPPMDGSREALARLAHTWRVVVFTTRTDTSAVWGWLARYALDGYVAEVTNVKPIAAAYIDDRAVTFTGWQAALYEIEARQPADGSGWLNPARAE